MAKYLVGIAIVLGACSTALAQAPPPPVTWLAEFDDAKCTIVKKQDLGDNDYYEIKMYVDYGVPAGSTGIVKIYYWNVDDNDYVEIESRQIVGEAQGEILEILKIVPGSDDMYGNQDNHDEDDFDFLVKIFDYNTPTQPEYSDTKTMSGDTSLFDSWAITLATELVHDGGQFAQFYEFEVGGDYLGTFADVTYQTAHDKDGVIVFDAQEDQNTVWHEIKVWAVIDSGTKEWGPGYAGSGGQGLSTGMAYDADGYTFRVRIFDADDWDFSAGEPKTGASAKASDEYITGAL